MIIRRPGQDLNLFEVRIELRRSFVHDLRTNAPPLQSHAKGGTFWLTDTAALRLFNGLTIDYRNARDEARRRYDEVRADDEPQWGELERCGLIRECAGRVWVTELGEHLARTQSLPALRELHDQRFAETYTVDGALVNDPELADIVAAIEARTASSFDVGCQSPAWIAARLWELLPQPATQGAVLQWVAKWHDLGWPDIAPSALLSPEHASGLIDAALDAIEANLSDDGWSLLRGDIVDRSASLAAVTPPVPQTALDRLQWLDRLHWTHDRISEDSHILNLVGIVLRHIAATEYASVPFPQAERLFELALGRPAVLHAIASWCASLPVLLADLVINSNLCAAACALIGQRPAAWSNNMSFAVVDDSDRDRESAFSDAVTVLAYLFDTDRTDAENVASLFTWSFREDETDFVERRQAVLSRLRHLAKELTPTRLQAVGTALQASHDFELATPPYVAALELLGSSSIADLPDPMALVTGYIDPLRRGGYSLSVRHVSEEAAAVVMRLAASTAAGAEILGPPAELFSLTPSDEPQPTAFSEEARRARAVRAHVRVLCRSLTRLEDDVRTATLNALVRVVRYGACSPKNGGVVGAFAARYAGSPYGDDDRPIAEDLAVALDAAKEEDRARLLHEIVGMDEPYTLAQLYALVRPDIRASIASRLSQLGPNEAGPIQSLVEMQLRIDALLGAGFVNEAQAFINAERAATTLGRVQHRGQTQFVYDLRTALLREDWQAIYSARVPDDIDSIDRQSTEESIAFYRGVANLLDPNGNPTYAAQVFTNLAWRHPQVPAYTHNLLVARVRDLFGNDLFAILPEERRAEARTAIADAERALTALSATDADRDRINGYRGLVFLALNEPGAAIELLAPRVLATETPYLAAVIAVGQHRLGADAEAAHTLAAAREHFGDEKILRAAQAVVGDEARIVVQPEPDQLDDRARAIRDGLRDFRELDPHQQARAVHGFDDLSDFAIATIRDACVGFEDLVPVFPTTGTEDERKPAWNEDEYNGLLHKLVRAHVGFFGWSVDLESPGGHGVEGAGRRDITIKRGIPIYVVIEGVVVDRPAHVKWTRGTLSQHFIKLFAYSTCDVFVHVTYSEIDDRNELIPQLQKSAKEDAPAGYQYVDAQPLPILGSSPPGFVAQYTDGTRTRSVAFIVLDISQARMAQAARTADQRDPRGPKVTRPRRTRPPAS